MDALRRTAVQIKSKATDGLKSSPFHHLNLFISEQKAVVSSLSTLISARVNCEAGNKETSSRGMSVESPPVRPYVVWCVCMRACMRVYACVHVLG